MCHSKGPHFNLRMGGGGPKEFFGSEILAKRDFFWVYERHLYRISFGCEKTLGFGGAN